MTINHDEVSDRFRFHPASTKDRQQTHELIREECGALALVLLEICPESRELSLALTNLDQVCMYANAAVARHL